MTDSSVRNCQGDIKEFQPTIMVGVAAVWENVRKGILAQVNKLPTLTQKIFWSGYHAKMKMKKYHIPGGDMLGNVLFKKVREATGGHLRMVLNGGSPLSIDAQELSLIHISRSTGSRGLRSASRSRCSTRTCACSTRSTQCTSPSAAWCSKKRKASGWRRRWATTRPSFYRTTACLPVSYTHLDVYKRQRLNRNRSTLGRSSWR